MYFNSYAMRVRGTEDMLLGILIINKLYRIQYKRYILTWGKMGSSGDRWEYKNIPLSGFFFRVWGN